MAPQYALAHQVRALLLDEQGRYSDAIEELQRALGLFGASSLLTGALGRAYARAGQRDRARQLLHELEATERGAGIDPVAAALVHVGLGEADEAFKRLGEACEYRSTQLLWLQVSSVWEPLRSGPRFQQLLTKNGRISTAFTRSLPSESPPAV
jgi:tetratricopeptide (TPR) repeat protein